VEQVGSRRFGRRFLLDLCSKFWNLLGMRALGLLVAIFLAGVFVGLSLSKPGEEKRV